ncbi:MAG TPA: quinone oxidoreductase [Polyangiaceae bacterium]
MTRAIRIAQYGGPEVMSFETIELRDPGPGEARVRHTAIGVNYVDTYNRSGLYPGELPSGLGVEAAGVVEAIGPGVDIPLGARVAYATAGVGAYSEARIVPANQLLAIPDEVSDGVAAAVLLKGLTVEYLLRRTYVVCPGDTVLFHAAAGGVGLIAGQWLGALGVHAIGVVGTEEKAELARANGYEHVLLASSDIPARVRELTGGKGVPVVYDSVGKATFYSSLDCLMPRGLLVSFGNASGKPDPFDPLVLSQKGSLYITRPKLADYVGTREELVTAGEAVFSVVKSGVLRLIIGQRFPLAEAAEAHRALEERRTTGSTLLFP